MSEMHPAPSETGHVSWPELQSWGGVRLGLLATHVERSADHLVERRVSAHGKQAYIGERVNRHVINLGLARIRAPASVVLKILGALTAQETMERTTASSP